MHLVLGVARRKAGVLIHHPGMKVVARTILHHELWVAVDNSAYRTVGRTLVIAVQEVEYVVQRSHDLNLSQLSDACGCAGPRGQGRFATGRGGFATEEFLVLLESRRHCLRQTSFLRSDRQVLRRTPFGTVCDDT